MKRAQAIQSGTEFLQNDDHRLIVEPPITPPAVEDKFPCDICGCWKDVDQPTRLCSDHENTDLDGNPLKSHE